MVDEEEKVAGLSSEDVKNKVHALDATPISKMPLFMSELPDTKDSNVPLEALQALLYEGTPEEQALNFKTQGNESFSMGKPGFKDALKFYTKGIEAGGKDEQVNATLYLNRSAVNLSLQNWGDSLRDARRALELWPKDNEVKAYRRILLSSIKLEKVQVAKDALLKLQELNITLEGEILRELDELEHRVKKEEIARRELEKEVERIKTIVKDTNIQVKLGVEKELFAQFGDNINPIELPSVSFGNQKRTRVWPVILMYPAVAQSDFLQSVDEQSTLKDLLKIVFESPPEWDSNNHYTNIDNLRIFWHHPSEKDRLVELSPVHRIREVVDRLVKIIERGILPIYIVPKGPDSDQLVSRFPNIEKL